MGAGLVGCLELLVRKLCSGGLPSVAIDMAWKAEHDTADGWPEKWEWK